MQVPLESHRICIYTVSFEYVVKPDAPVRGSITGQR
jgi:hypothetical protein